MIFTPKKPQPTPMQTALNKDGADKAKSASLAGQSDCQSCGCSDKESKSAPVFFSKPSNKQKLFNCGG